MLDILNHLHFLQVIGWSMYFAEYLFLERSWAKDEKTLKVTLYLTCALKSIFPFLHFCDPSSLAYSGASKG
jgi:hypothetical protein